MCAAEGSDWFWWYGDDQSAPGGDQPFDRVYLNQLRNVYLFAERAGANIRPPDFAPIIAGERGAAGVQGTMARSRGEMQTVTFKCNASAEKVPRAIFIAGNLPQLGDWTPNLIAMHDDGRGGDPRPNDGIWSITVEVPIGIEIQYKYCKSGARGVWISGEAFPVRNRTFIVTKKSSTPLILNDTFGK